MNKTAYGGSLRKKRNGRGRRPLSTRATMHLVMRSTQARGELSFKKPRNEKRISAILEKFSVKFCVRVISNANVGNHLHLHVHLRSRRSYNAFIRAVTGAIAQMIMQASRLRPIKKKFWDQRPFTRVVFGIRDYFNVEAYIQLNQLEGFGLTRAMAKLIMMAYGRVFPH